jgi:hypothetical protein
LSGSAQYPSWTLPTARERTPSAPAAKYETSYSS